MDDTEIISLLWNREEAGISELERKYHAYCNTVAMNILQNAEDAEECVSDTWMKIWNSIPPSRPESLKLYAARITRNLAFNRYRESHTEKRGGGQLCIPLEELSECISAQSCMDDALKRRELTGIVQRFVADLHTKDRTLFLRRYYYADDIPTIAVRYKMTENYVSVSLYRIRKRLKKLLEKEGYGV